MKKILFTISIIIYGLMLRYMLNVILPFMLAIACFFALKPIIDYLDNHFRMKKSAIGVSILLVIYLLTIVLLGALLTLIIIYILQLIGEVPYYYETIMTPFFNQIVSWIQQEIPLFMNQDNLSLFYDFLGNTLLGVVASFSSIVSQVPSFLFSFFIFIISTFFLFLEYDEVKDKIIGYCSHGFLKAFIAMKNQTMKGIKIYVKCQLILMIMSFLILWFGFYILKMDHSFLYALFTSFLDSLPFIGVGIVLIPVCMIYLLEGAYLNALYVFLIYLIINVIRSLLEPQIMNKEIKIPSFLLIFSMCIHLYLFGFIGVILSPIHMNLLYCVLDYYKQKA